RRFALHGRIGRDDHLAHRAVAQALEQLANAQRLGPHAVERRDRPVQDVVETAKLLRLLHRDQIRRLLHHADFVALALAVAADVAERAVLVLRVDFAEAEAAPAQAHFLAQFADGVGQEQHVAALRFQQVKGQAGGGFFADAGKLRELLHQAGERRRIQTHGISPGIFTPPVILLISAATRSRALRMPSLTAASTRSSSISFSSGLTTDASIFTAVTLNWPLTVT